MRAVIRKGNVWIVCPACRDVERDRHAALGLIEPSPFDGLHRIPIEGLAPVWSFNGSADLPTLQPSLRLTYNYGEEKSAYCCHSIITDGRIAYCSDCTHALAGQTVDLPEVTEDVFD